MQINFKSFFASLLGERLLHRLKTRVLLLWNASWCDTRLCLLSLGWQLSGRLWVLQGPDLEEFCGAASTRHGTAILLGKKKKNLGLIHDSGVERARERQRAVFRCDTGEPRVPLHMGVTAGFVPWLWNLEVEPLPCSPEDLTRATETKELLRVRVELSSEKVCSIIVLCYLGFKNYLLQILGQDREEQGHVKIIFASTLCLAWCARLATFHSFLPDRGKCSQGNAKLRNYLEESSGAVK